MAKGCVYILKTGKDAGQVFGSKESLAAHMNYTPALADMMSKYQSAGGKMDVDSVTKWLTDNGYIKAEAAKPTTKKTEPTKKAPTEKKPAVKKEFPKAPVTDTVKAALKSVDNTTAAVMNLAKVLPTVYESIAKQVKLSIGKPASQQISEAYHNAVENGVEPELVAAVENAVALQEQMKSKPSLSGEIETNETLEMEGVPTGTRAGNKASIDALERKHSDNATKKAVIATVKKAARTLKSVFPSMDIHIHEDPKQYAAAMAGLNGQRNSTGNFTYTTSSDGTTVGRIDINLSTATPRTVVHEVTHAILLKTFGDNAPAFLDFRNKIEKIISESGNKRLSDFADRYKDITDEIGQAEEYLAELSGILSDKQTPLDYGIIRKVMELINKFVSTVTFDKFQPFEEMQDQKDALEFFNSIAQGIKAGTEVETILATNNIFINETPNTEGQVGVFKMKSKSSLPAPKASEDSRPWIKELVTDAPLTDFNGKPFVTNMYDYTTAGEVDMGNGNKIQLMGGKSYVPYMMHLQGKKIGDVSNLAAFNTMAQAETFIRNAKSGGANLFAPHSGTLTDSWQFQQHTFAELVGLIVDKKLLTNKELIGVFNGTIESNAFNKKAFKQFKSEYFDKYGKRINNFSSFINDPKAIIDLLDIQNNFSPNLRKALNDAISGNKKFQKELGIKNKEQFYNLIADPLNAGVKGGEIISVVDFDPNSFQIVKTQPDAIDHHPSFGYTLLAKINGIYQPTEFYKSYDVTETYTKYNKESTDVSRKSDGFEKFVLGNVTSSAGAIPKVAQFDVKSKAQLVYDETGFISTDSMIEIVGANDPTYLGDVMNHILEMGEKLRSGNVGPTDLAKAYMMAVSSIRSGDLTISKFEDAIGQNVDEVFVEKERGKIRTEGAMAYLLTTPEGKRMLDNIGRGKISAKDRAFIAKSMKPFGMFSEGESKFDNLFGSTEDKQINLTNINEFADMLKGGVKDQQQLFNGIAKLKGISQAKVGFVSNFLGIGTRGVIDAREIKGWLRGVVFKGDFTEAEAEMNKQLTKSNKNLTPLQKEILRRMRVVGDAFNIEPALSEYIGHHMIWDAVKNERTTHDGLYLAMKQNEDEFNNRLAEIKAKPEIKSKAQLSSVEETAKALDNVYSLKNIKESEGQKESEAKLIRADFGRNGEISYEDSPNGYIDVLNIERNKGERVASKLGGIGEGAIAIASIFNKHKDIDVIYYDDDSEGFWDAIGGKTDSLTRGDFFNYYNKKTKQISEAYHKAKEDGSNPELVKAVEDLVGKPEVKSKPQLADNNAKEVADLYAKMREGGGWAERQKINAILDRDPKLSYIYSNFKEITRMLEDAQLLTKSGNCP